MEDMAPPATVKFGKLKVRYVAASMTDKGSRYFGSVVNAPLSDDFWLPISKSGILLGEASSGTFVKEETIDLVPGVHTISFGTSAEYPWVAKLFVNDEPAAIGKINNEKSLTATVTVRQALIPKLLGSLPLKEAILLGENGVLLTSIASLLQEVMRSLAPILAIISGAIFLAFFRKMRFDQMRRLKGMLKKLSS